MFTLLVGPDEEELVVHGTHLAKSPALARMCDGGFAESGSRIIRMPEDDPTCMGCVIRYFYKDDFEVISQPNRKQETVPVLEIGWSAQETTEYPWSAETESTKEANNKPSSDPVALEILAGVYTLAEKYQITDLLDLCLKKMGPFIDLTSDPGSFLWIARIIYDKTLASDKVFRPYFRDHCPAMLMGFGKDKKNGYRVVNEHISEGGDLAVDVFEAYRDLYRIQEILEPDNGAIWFPPGTTDPARVSEIIENHVETLKKKAHRLEFEHAVHHPHCKSHLDDSCKYPLPIIQRAGDNKLQMANTCWTVGWMPMAGT